MIITGSICRQCLKRLVISCDYLFRNQTKRFNRLQIGTSNQSRFLTTSPTRLKETNVSKSTVSDNQLQLRYLYVHTSFKRWDDVPDGILLDVGYGDSMPDKTWSPATPTVLALHSSPGSHESLAPVLQPFVKMGCRVIAPNFPGFGYTEGISAAYNDVFNHSTDEKAEFVRDFLDTLNVESVDLVIGHGSACYPLLRLATTKDTAHLFKSAVLISPWPHREFKGVQPSALHNIVSLLWDRPFLRFWCRMASIAAKQTLGLRGASFTDVITTCRTVSTIGFDEVAGFLVAADMMDFPIITFFSEDDPFISKELYHELTDLLDVEDGHETIVNEEGKVSKAATLKGFPRSVRFEKGGHDLHLRYPGLINALSWDLMKYIRPDVR